MRRRTGRRRTPLQAGCRAARCRAAPVRGAILGAVVAAVVALAAPVPGAAPLPAGGPPDPAVRRAVITVADGQVLGGARRLTVPRSRPVQLIVQSDVADTVRVRGYRVSAPVPAGGAGVLGFVTEQLGVFPVELAGGLRIAELVVGGAVSARPPAPR